MSKLRDLEDLRRRRLEHAELQRALDAELEQTVRAAFEAGHTGPAIAAAAGLSKPRAYQIRDGRR